MCCIKFEKAALLDHVGITNSHGCYVLHGIEIEFCPFCGEKLNRQHKTRQLYQQWSQVKMKKPAPRSRRENLGSRTTLSSTWSQSETSEVIMEIKCNDCKTVLVVPAQGKAQCPKCGAYWELNQERTAINSTTIVVKSIRNALIPRLRGTPTNK